MVDATITDPILKTLYSWTLVAFMAIILGGMVLRCAGWAWHGVLQAWEDPAVRKARAERIVRTELARGRERSGGGQGVKVNLDRLGHQPPPAPMDGRHGDHKSQKRIP